MLSPVGSNSPSLSRGHLSYCTQHAIRPVRATTLLIQSFSKYIPADNRAQVYTPVYSEIGVRLAAYTFVRGEIWSDTDILNGVLTGNPALAG